MLKLTSVLLLLFVVFSTVSLAQKGTHNPYSTFGLGELQTNNYASFQSMGGIGLAASDSAIVNHSNPATYSNFSRFRPIFQVGLNGRLSRFETATNSTVQRNFRLDQFQLGIPIKRQWGAAIGLKPYAFTGYHISNYVVEDGDSTQLYTREGSGGINQVYLGVSYRPLNKKKLVKKYVVHRDTSGNKIKDSLRVERTAKLSIGANVNYLFGSNKRTRTFQYASVSQGLNAKVTNSTRMKDFMYDIGLSYQFGWRSSNYQGKVKNANMISIAATYSPAISMNAFSDLFSYSYVTLGGGFNGPEALSDTVEYVVDNSGSIQIPESYKAGLEWRFGSKSQASPSFLKIGADVRYQRWSQYSENFGDTYENQMKDRLRMAMGLEWTPNPLGEPKSTPFLSQIHYRLGFNYTMMEQRILNNSNNYTDLTDYGMSFGLGIPVAIVRYSNTNINFGANIGRLGTKDNGLIQEEYLSFFFGVSITPGYGNYWFKKRKYD